MTLVERVIQHDLGHDFANGDTKYSADVILAAAREFDAVEAELVELVVRADAALDAIYLDGRERKPEMYQARRFHFTDPAHVALFDCIHIDMYEFAQIRRFGTEKYPLSQWNASTRRMRVSTKRVRKAMTAVIG